MFESFKLDAKIILILCLDRAVDNTLNSLCFRYMLRVECMNKCIVGSIGCLR